MKLPFTIYDLRFTIWKKSAASVAANHQSSIVNHKSHQGVALIITIILLGVVTFMAVAFLALSRRERGAVTTVTDTASARLAADAALAGAEAQIVANVLSTTNPCNFGLLVSTNYINYAGFLTDPTDYTNFNNVNYQYPNGNALSINDSLQNLANLWYSPRPPVFIPTNAAGANDFRFYLDLNRNGRFDLNGWVTNVDNNGNIILDGSGNAVTNFQVGDPEWIGILERPDAPYGPNNKFIARYAFIAVPVGNTLDLNAIYNQAGDGGQSPTYVNPPPNGLDGYLRNQGVGSWEINLAAFLADLNANQWGQVIGNANNGNNTYYYYQYPGNGNQGYAFSDARALLASRYTNYYTSLNTAFNLYGPPGQAAFQNDIDEYSNGPLMTNTAGINVGGQYVTWPWAGADNTNHFFTPEDLFNSNEISPQFVNRLLAAGNTNSTYDRYTFYRLLSQLGTDSTPDSGKMNLNYDNLDPFVTNNGVNTVIYPPASTNFMAWTPLGFFTNAADRLLRAYTTQWRFSSPTNFAATYYSVPGNPFNSAGYSATNFAAYPAFGVTNIPVLMSNQFVYSPAVNRLLQLAANMYDATTTTNYPSVFRPTFWVTNEFGCKNVYINGYEDVSAYSQFNGLAIGYPPLDSPTNVESLPLGSVSGFNYGAGGGYGHNVYGVPWIIGAKKGLPSFNQLYMIEAAQITRKLEVTRRSTNSLSSDFKNYDTNQMYVLSISNNIGVSLWNSYSNYYPRQLTVYISDGLWMNMTNGAKFWSSNASFASPQLFMNPWPGSQWGASGMAAPGYTPYINTGSFYYTNWSFSFLPESVYQFGAATFAPDALGVPVQWETNLTPYELPALPQFQLMSTNYLQAFILDGNHVIDYVQLRGPLDNTSLNQAIADPDYPDNTMMRYQWSTNLYQGPLTYGVYNQIEVSENQDSSGLNPNFWIRPPNMPASMPSIPAAESAFFNGFFQPNFRFEDVTYTNSEPSVQVPFTPSRTAYNYILWQANDPLVHYLASDLNYVNPGIIGWKQSDDPKLQPLQATTQNAPGDRFQPWGLKKQMAGLAGVDTNAYNLTYKDSLIWCPDNWDFPTNKYPTVGWLGRVHRGTPWQTVYLKASGVGTNTWVNWTGDMNLYDADNMAPGQDRLMFDLFTTAFNDNATRGTLSVNQSAGSSDPAAGLAAWSALFSGMVAISNNTAVPYASYTVRPTTTWMNINPAGVYNTALSLTQQPPLVQIAQSINNLRGNTNLFPLGAFTHAGDILRAPALTEQSPFLNINGVNGNLPPFKNGISDEMYEWLPQQMMSLLRCSTSPRYVIYCYGQALKPAPDSVVTSSSLLKNGINPFGMVTNYQIVSEIATRAVVRFNSMMTNVITSSNDASGNIYWYSMPVVTNNNAVIESFNILPPD
jgi:hypothetical protein